MTYCCGILVHDGLVMIADTRTNAGLDNISTFRKLHVFCEPGERVMEIETLLNSPSMFQAAQRIGKTIRRIYATEAAALDALDVKFDVAFLFGGQIMGERQRMFMIYTAGNFIECTKDTPYLQIGEHKYGKPILDRAVTYNIDLYDGLKIGLLSMDSTIRSNLGVGMPIDIFVARPDLCEPELSHRINPGDPYFHDLSERWSAALRAAHNGIPRPPYANQR